MHINFSKKNSKNKDDIPAEFWRPIPGYEGLYDLDLCSGRVRSYYDKKTGEIMPSPHHILSPRVTKDPKNPSYALFKDKVRKEFTKNVLINLVVTHNTFTSSISLDLSSKAKPANE